MPEGYTPTLIHLRAQERLADTIAHFERALPRAASFGDALVATLALHTGACLEWAWENIRPDAKVETVEDLADWIWQDARDEPFMSGVAEQRHWLALLLCLAPEFPALPRHVERPHRRAAHRG